VQRKFLLIPIAVVLLGIASAAAWYFGNHRAVNSDALTLYGNVDIRQVQLAFNGSERIATMQVREGEPVKKGQLLATLDEDSRQEQVNKAQADVKVASINADNAASNYRRAKELAQQHFISSQQEDDAHAKANAAQAALEALRAALEVARKALADASLYAPDNGLVQERILEPGDMASPQRPVYTLALADPVWVRAYVQGPDLGKLQQGVSAEVSTDSFPGKKYRAWVGYISPTAEFTPKAVETTEVRSSLVYQVRIFVCNPQGELRMGMPATVTIPLGQPVVKDSNHCQDS
jgi:membrane fusion protein YbhG